MRGMSLPEHATYDISISLNDVTLIEDIKNYGSLKSRIII